MMASQILLAKKIYFLNFNHFNKAWTPIHYLQQEIPYYIFHKADPVFSCDKTMYPGESKIENKNVVIDDKQKIMFIIS